MPPTSSTTQHSARASTSTSTSTGTSTGTSTSTGSALSTSSSSSVAPSTSSSGASGAGSGSTRSATNGGTLGASSGGTPGAASSAGAPGGPLALLRRWLAKSRQMQQQLSSLGLAGVVAYGLLNTLYYTITFLVVWFTVAKVPSGLGADAAARRFIEVFAMVWAGSQVTKLARAGGALALAPLVDRCLGRMTTRLRLRSKQHAFGIVLLACLALATTLFGAVLAYHA